MAFWQSLHLVVMVVIDIQSSIYYYRNFHCMNGLHVLTCCLHLPIRWTNGDCQQIYLNYCGKIFTKCCITTSCHGCQTLHPRLVDKRAVHTTGRNLRRFINENEFVLEIQLAKWLINVILYIRDSFSFDNQCLSACIH